ncbi:MAG: GFA family protein [Gammaproteobacteria bacterium]|nr:GFA family protein [Gammaproteobacteria bacterium]
MSLKQHEGGCLCGDVRFQVTGDPLWIAHCHCDSCRRNTAAVMATFMGVRQNQFIYVKGEPAQYHSSPGVTRSFCNRCGTPLTYEADHYKDEVHVNIGSLDSPQDFAPQKHVWVDQQLPWLRVDEHLPRYAATARKSSPI